ncbi:MAG: 50S ribosomal protein L35 [Candidatus Omnitrophica bacterium]|nr:50S ribosomal protein L35 [Candidatus Omnitrophota bacterium]
MLKTKKGVAKRFKLTKKGKIKYYPGGKSHLQTNKNPKRVRGLRHGRTVKNKKEAAYLKKMLPYG